MKPNKEKEKSKKDTKSENKTSTVYSAIWKDGPRIKWDQQNEEYKGVKTKVTIIKKDGNDVDQINEILNELKIYLNCHTQEYALLIQFYGISKHPDSNDYFIVKQFHENTSSLTEYISHKFDSLNWEMKLRLLLYLSEDLKSLHNAKYVHRYYKYPSSVLVFDNSFCAIETFLECKALPLTNTDEKGGRPHIPDNIPKSFKNLMEKCWNTEPDLRPNIHEVHNALLNLWSSIYYYDKNLTSLNLACLEYLAADNNKDYSNSKPQEIIPQQAESSNLRLSDIIDSMKRLVKFIKMNELTTKTPIGSMTSTYILKENGLVFCKRLKNGQLVRDESIKVFIHKLNMQNKPGFRLRIIPILGMSFDESINEHLLVMQYADSGNLRQFLKNHLEKLNWDDKIKLAYQITEGIKYLHDEDIFHYNLHSKNILIHQEEAKIILDIAKNSEISFIDPKLLEDDSYEYDKKSDIYSLGVLMWEISSSKPPFADGKVSENLLKNDLIGKILYAQPKKIHETSELVSLIKDNRLTEIIDKKDLSKEKSGYTILKVTQKKTECLVVLKTIILNEAFIHELKMHKTLNSYFRIVPILGISLDESTNECLLITEYANGGNLRQYLKNQENLTWNNKIKLAYQITEGIKYLHDKDINHQSLYYKNIVIHKKEAKIILDIAKSTKSDYLNDNEMNPYLDPKFLEDDSYEYDKNIDAPIPGTTNEYLNLYKSCCDSESNKRPSISQVFNKLEVMNKNLGAELINLIIEQKLVKLIDRSELTDIEKIDAGHFGIISRAIWKKTNNYVVCKKLNNNESISNKPIEAFLHELKMVRRLDFCQRIIRILGIILDESTKEYLFVMQYADSGNLRKYLKNRFSTLSWDDKIKLAYQITDGIKFLQGENILHRDLHSKNIVIHQGEAKIIDLGIAKSIETQTNIHSGVMGMIAYNDPK
ncbi:unnamed protein product [Rhizophagus irregularis]|nr:unnamed protein product [Rhizophagus irregularis]